MTLKKSGAQLPTPVLEAMLRDTRMAMIVCDATSADMPIVYANPAFETLTGYSAGEIIGRNCRFLQGPDTSQETRAEIAKTVAEGGRGLFEILNYRKDGTPFWNALHVSPVKDDEGRITHFFGSQWEVSARHDVIDALDAGAGADNASLQSVIDRARIFEQALDHARDSVLLTEYAPIDEPGPRILWVSKGFERMTGYSTDEVVGRSPRFLQGPETDREVLSKLRTDLESGEGRLLNRAINYRKDGTPFVVEWSVSPVLSTSGDPLAWLAVQRDVTRRVENEQERERLLAELDHRVRNLFATVLVITRGADDGDGTADSLRRRLVYQLQALSSAHAVVFSDASHHGELSDIVNAVLQPFDPDGARIIKTGGPGSFDSKQAINAAIILYELALLSSERGALASRKPVELSWQKVGRELCLTWSEDASLPEDNRFGFSLVRTFVKSSKWDEAGIDAEDGRLTVRLGLRAVED